MKSKVAIKSCFTYDLDKLQEVITESLNLIGGPSVFFKPGKTCLVKPNLLTNAKPEEGITTHPHFVQASGAHPQEKWPGSLSYRRNEDKVRATHLRVEVTRTT